jgi:Uma2 family endonuclease
MTTVQDIQQAIRQLSRLQREDLAEWILNLADFGDGVAETALAYGDLPGSRHLTVDEYLLLEDRSPIRHEYVGGEIFAISGEVVRHSIIAGELLVNFKNHLQGGPCTVFTSRIKVRVQVAGNDIFYYPDVVVACGPLDMDSTYLTHPSLIVEVLSPSTLATDRREKRLNYRHIQSLEEYVLVAQWPPQVTIYRRSEDWVPIVLTTLEAMAEFRSIGLNMALGQIYEGARSGK